MPEPQPDPIERDRPALLTALLDGLDHGVVAVDSRGKWFAWNRAATELLGAEPATSANPWPPCVDLTDPGAPAAVAAPDLPLARALRGQVIDGWDLAMRDPATQQERTLRCSSRPIRGRDGRQVGAVCSFGDVTSQRAAEHERSQFARRLAHDLKAPLAGIIGLAEVVGHDYTQSLGADGRGLIEEIVRTGLRMSQMLDDLLTWVRVDSSRQTLTETDLNGVLRDAVEAALMDSDDDTRQAAVIEVADDAPRVLGDHAGLVVLFRCLLSNALKFHAPGATPQVEVRFADHDGGHRVTVLDHGIGIDPRFAAEIFEVFRRLHGPSEYDGTGVGLAIARRIAELHGGTMGIDSEDGATAFWVDLPALP